MDRQQRGEAKFKPEIVGRQIQSDCDQSYENEHSPQQSLSPGIVEKTNRSKKKYEGKSQE